MRRGFKAEAERQAASLRATIGASDYETVNLSTIAQHLRVAVLPADSLVEREELFALHDVQPGAFSGATICLPDGRQVVIYNPIGVDGQYITPPDAMRNGRTRSDIAHELAHIILGHVVRQVQKVSGNSFFTCNYEQEQEATWLGGCLLLPRPLLLNAARRGDSDEKIATTWCVSPEMAKFRMNLSGVRMQASRGR